MREPEQLHDADIQPADVELVPLVGQPGRARKRVVIVVQLFAADQDAPGKHVGAGIRHRPTAITEEVADAVDHASRPERDPGDLRDQDQHAGDDAEQNHVDHPGEGQAKQHIPGIQVVFEPIVGGAVAVALHGLGLVRFLHIQEHAAPQHPVDAEHLRAVRVIRCFTLGVVLAVDRDPLAGCHAGGHPEPEAEEMAHYRVQVEGAMRLAAVQKHRDADDGDMGQPEGHQNQLPPRQIEYARKQHRAHGHHRNSCTGAADQQLTAGGPAAVAPGQGGGFGLSCPPLPADSSFFARGR